MLFPLDLKSHDTFTFEVGKKELKNKQYTIL
jgi:hypothetical protein